MGLTRLILIAAGLAAVISGFMNASYPKRNKAVSPIETTTPPKSVSKAPIAAPAGKVFIDGKYYDYNPRGVYMVKGVPTFFKKMPKSAAADNDAEDSSHYDPKEWDDEGHPIKRAPVPDGSNSPSKRE